MKSKSLSLRRRAAGDMSLFSTAGPVTTTSMTLRLTQQYHDDIVSRANNTYESV